MALFRRYVGHPDNPDAGYVPGEDQGTAPAPDPTVPPPVAWSAPPAAEPPSAPGGGHGGGGNDYAGPTEPIFNFPGAPVFTPPTFAAPTLADAQNDPGYQLGLTAGNNALQNNAAARGTVRSGGALKNLIEYSNNYATSKYNDVYNRTLQAYDRQYQGAHDAYAPHLAEWQNAAKAEMARALAAYTRPWEMYQFQHRGGGGGGGGQIEPPPELSDFLNQYGDLGSA
jgi:hypothetical protein